MAFPTAVNSQITDAVTQINVQVLGVSPATALGSYLQGAALALTNAGHNAAAAQQQMNILAQAVTTAGVNLIYAAHPAVGAPVRGL
ncbi:hypothetical protein QO010_000561 [Caulobacter ginsengisoli]|uniref:RebB like protein n=1 Tax=Caulobacter ginsengisoli TaxID=400775 RepID=A0ABU0ILC0_9CAUL|nr:RebB family R body protein [Caulobacter ginsengisoli]MDQ0462813.1 hypothetical protein [Caulobacter ginsengisoli]